MKVGDLVKLTQFSVGRLGGLYGIILDIYPDPEGEFGGLKVSVLWADGDITQGFWVDLEVVSSCK